MPWIETEEDEEFIEFIKSYNEQQKPKVLELLDVVSADERKIIETFLKLKNGDAVEFDTMSEELFAWAKKLIGEKEHDT